MRPPVAWTRLPSRSLTGVLVKDAAALERMAGIDTLVVDKTGTLTEGRPVLTDVIPADGVDRDALLSLAASLENGSEHPLADAIVTGAREAGLTLARTEAFESHTGRGVSGTVREMPWRWQATG